MIEAGAADAQVGRRSVGGAQFPGPGGLFGRLGVGERFDRPAVVQRPVLVPACLRQLAAPVQLTHPVGGDDHSQPGGQDLRRPHRPEVGDHADRQHDLPGTGSRVLGHLL